MYTKTLTRNVATTCRVLYFISITRQHVLLTSYSLTLYTDTACSGTKWSREKNRVTCFSFLCHDFCCWRLTWVTSHSKLSQVQYIYIVYGPFTRIVVVTVWCRRGVHSEGQVRVFPLTVSWGRQWNKSASATLRHCFPVSGAIICFLLLCFALHHNHFFLSSNWRKHKMWCRKEKVSSFSVKFTINAKLKIIKLTKMVAWGLPSPIYYGFHQENPVAFN